MNICKDCRKIKWVWQESGVANPSIHKACQDNRLRVMLRHSTTLPEKKGILGACQLLAQANHYA